MKNRPSVSEEELARLMDFTQVLAGYGHHHQKVVRWRRLAAGSSLIAGLTLVIYLMMQPAVQVSTPTRPQVTGPQPSPSHPIADSTSTQTISAPAAPRQPSVKKKAESPPPVFVEEAPPSYTPAQPLRGYEDLYEYFQRELRYPEAVLADSLEGIVTISFLINKQGQPEQIKVEQSLGPLFDEEALRLVHNMPPWEPARLGKNATLSKLTLPITFRIEK